MINFVKEKVAERENIPQTQKLIQTSARRNTQQQRKLLLNIFAAASTVQLC